MRQLNLIAFVKYLASFLKSDWTLSDYPLRIRQQDVNEPPIGSFKPVAWHVQIVHWWQMSGSGDTRDEAIANITRNFNDYKRQHDAVPRPGTHVPIQLAPTTEIDQYSGIAHDFFEKILEMDFDSCFVSDQSSLWDFPNTSDEVRVFELIKQTYQVDVSDIQTGNLAQIFKRLHEHSSNASASTR